MTFPGGDILNAAMSLVGAQTVAWSKFLGMATNAAGVDVASFSPAVNVIGSFQPVSATLVQQLGLDMTKNYATFFASREFGDPDRNKAGDRLSYAGKVWQVESKTPWNPQDGWEYVLCVELTNAI